MLQEIADMGKVNVALRLSRNRAFGPMVGFILGVLVLVVLAFGYGYFFGRQEQIVLNKSLLKAIPDVNCGTGSSLSDTKT